MPSGQRVSRDMAKLIHNSYRKYKSHRAVASLLSRSKGAIASVLRRYDGDTGLPLVEGRTGAHRATSPSQDAKIVELHRRNPDMSLKRLGQAVGVSEATAFRRIKESKEKPRRKKVPARSLKTTAGDPKSSSKITDLTVPSEINPSKNKGATCRVEYVMKKKPAQMTVIPPKRLEAKPGVKPDKPPLQKKRPPAEFVIFYCHMRPTVQAQNPDCSPAEVGKRICAMWSACSRPDRHKYFQLAGEICTVFDSEMTGNTFKSADTVPSCSSSEADTDVSEEFSQSPIQARELHFIEPYRFNFLPECERQCELLHG